MAHHAGGVPGLHARLTHIFIDEAHIIESLGRSFRPDFQRLQGLVETLRRAGRLHADLQYGRIDEILATGLHAYLTQFLDRIGDLGMGISRDFLVPVTH